MVLTLPGRMGNSVGKSVAKMSSNTADELPEWAQLQLAEQEEELAANRVAIQNLSTSLHAAERGCRIFCLRITGLEASEEHFKAELEKKSVMLEDLSQKVAEMRAEDDERYKMLFEKNEEQGKKLLEMYGGGKLLMAGNEKMKELEEKVKELQKFKNEATRLKTKAKEAREKVENKDRELKNKQAEYMELEEKYAALEVSQTVGSKNAPLAPVQQKSKQQKSRKSQWMDVQARFADEIAAEVKKHVTPIQDQINTANAALEVSRKNAANGSEKLKATKATIAAKESEIECMMTSHARQLKDKDNELQLYRHVVNALWPIRSRHAFKYLTERTARMIHSKYLGDKIAHEGVLDVDVALCVLGYFDPLEVSLLEKAVYQVELAPFLGSFEKWQSLMKPSMQLTRELARIGGTLFGSGDLAHGEGDFKERRDRLVKELHRRLKGIKNIAKADEIRNAYYNMPEVQAELECLGSIADLARRREWMRRLGREETESDVQSEGSRIVEVYDEGW